MPQKKFLRFIDNKHREEILNDAEHFIKRIHGLPNYLFSTMLIGALAGSATLTMLLLYDIFQKAVHIPGLNGLKIILLLGGSILIVGAMGVYTILYVQKTRKILLYTEFQNLVFSSIVRADCDFAVILNRKGYMLYFDRRANDLLKITSQPDFHNASSLFGEDGFDEEARSLVESALQTSQVKEFEFKKQAGDGKYEVYDIKLTKPENMNFLTAIRGYKK